MGRGAVIGNLQVSVDGKMHAMAGTQIHTGELGFGFAKKIY